MPVSSRWIGVSAPSRAVEEEINRAARSDAKVLITGESGVGKQIPANLILDAAVACPAHFERSQDEIPARTIAHFDAPRGGITN